MQTLVITLLGLATLVLAVVCAAQWRQLRSTQERLHAAEELHRTEATAREVQSTKLAELERANTRLDQQVREFTSVTTTLRTKDATQSSNLTALASQLRTASGSDAGADSKPGFGKEMGDMVQKMMKDPAMREMMRSQQESAIKMMYGGLLKQLNLSPEEKDKFMGILTDLQLKTIETDRL